MADDTSGTGRSALVARPQRTGVLRSTGRRRKPRDRRQRMLRGVAFALAGTLLLGAGGAVAMYLRLNGNISDIDIEAVLGTDRPEDAPDGSLDILVLGSDSRSGANGVYGRENGARSDTAMIVHVNEGHETASVVSIPRDTLLPRPACVRADGSTAAARSLAMFNEAYTVGGPACAVKTVESMTDVRMDHYVEVDFKGFEKLIDTLGGVEITTTQDVDDEKSRLTLGSGTHHLDGEQALALVRTRKSVGDGSDLGRIRLQHHFIRALTEQVGEVGLFSSPKKLYDLANTATSAVTTDSGIASVNELVALGRTLRGIGPDDLQMVTLPVDYDVEDPNRVVPREEQARQVWYALRDDRPVPAAATEDSAALAARSGDGFVR